MHRMQAIYVSSHLSCYRSLLIFFARIFLEIAFFFNAAYIQQ